MRRGRAHSSQQPGLGVPSLPGVGAAAAEKGGREEAASLGILA